MAGPGSRYVQLLDPRAAERMNNGTMTGGIASVLQRMLMAREAQRGQQQETDAYGAMARGMAAKPWIDPDTGKVAPGQAPAGGYEGGIAALQGAGANPYAGRLASQLMMQRASMEAEAAQRRAQSEAEFGMKASLPAAEAAALARAAGIPEGTPEFQEFIRQSARGAGGQETFGNNPIWGTGPDGKPVIMQLSNRGGARPVDLPPGYAPQRGQVRTVDVGNETIILDANGSFIGRMPKGIGPERVVRDGDALTFPAVPGGAPTGAPTGAPAPQGAPQMPPQGAAPGGMPQAAGVPQAAPQAGAPTITALPLMQEDEASARQSIADAQISIKLVEDLVNHPGFSDVIGMPGSISGAAAKALGTPLPGTDAAGFMARLKQIEGKQFLAAFESLKGGGHITEIEGTKATQAMSRLTETGQSEEEYRAAAQELIQILKQGLDRAKASMARGRQGGDAPAAPARTIPPPPPGFVPVE